MDRKWSKSDLVQVEIKEGLWKEKIYSEGLEGQGFWNNCLDK